MSVCNCYCPLPQLHVLNFKLELGKNRNKILSGGVVGLSVSQNWLMKKYLGVHWIRPDNLSVIKQDCITCITWRDSTSRPDFAQKQVMLQSLTKLSPKAQFCNDLSWKSTSVIFCWSSSEEMTQQFLFRPIPVFCMCFQHLNFHLNVMASFKGLYVQFFFLPKSECLDNKTLPDFNVCLWKLVDWFYVKDSENESLC